MQAKKGVNLISDEHYNKDKLKGLLYIKGQGQFLKPACEMLNMKDSTTSLKINGGKLTHEETILLAEGLELTPREYLDIFCSGVFTPKK